ncbi:MAG TPA: PspC domain-containing protein [Candidatus Limnocylindrales bacterium]
MSEETPTTAAQPAPPPPGAQEPWATRLGLVRPRHGRYIAGVCAAIGRATNTDPLLWRVLIGVLAIFGIGIVIYVTGWLLMPAEGDTASPVEALLGRGTSSTSTLFTLILGVIAVLLLGGLTDSWVVAVMAAVGIVIVAIAINNRAPNTRPAMPPPPMQQPMSMGTPASPVQPAPGEPVTEPLPGAIGPPVSGYQPPFAPHGPYPQPPLPPVPPKFVQKPEPSRLGRLIFGLILIALGLMGVADMAGAGVPGAAYFAVALGMVGIGLIIGAWYGRARGFIALGIVLTILLPAVADASDIGQRTRGGNVMWNPATIDRVSDNYEQRFGEATLDLTQVDFAGQDREISAEISFGNLQILLPPNVDTRVVSDISFGDAVVFGRVSNGVGVDYEQDDLGEDGPGGGNLLIRLDVRFGHAEVIR